MLVHPRGKRKERVSSCFIVMAECGELSCLYYIVPLGLVSRRVEEKVLVHPQGKRKERVSSCFYSYGRVW